MYSGHGFGSLTDLADVSDTSMEVVHVELTDVPGASMEVLKKSQKFRVGIPMLRRYPGYCGTGVQYLQTFRVQI